jgi:hypothetical protein
MAQRPILIQMSLSTSYELYDAGYNAGFVICGFAAEGWVT